MKVLKEDELTLASGSSAAYLPVYHYPVQVDMDSLLKWLHSIMGPGPVILNPKK